MRLARLVAVIGVALTLSACEWGPRGMGQLQGVVTSGATPVGAIVLEISGPGVQGFSETGQTRVFFAEPSSEVYRVALVAVDSDEVRFLVDVVDVRIPTLTVVVVEAVDDNNAAFTDLSGITVELNR